MLVFFYVEITAAWYLEDRGSWIRAQETHCDNLGSSGLGKTRLGSFHVSLIPVKGIPQHRFKFYTVL